MMKQYTLTFTQVDMEIKCMLKMPISIDSTKRFTLR